MKRLLSTLILIFIFAPIFSVKAAEPVKILLVPGHDNESWGAQYGNLKEAAMTLAVGKRIYDILKKDERFEVQITRDSMGYTEKFAEYFTNHEADIISFIESSKKERQDNIINGSFIERENPPHNTANKDRAIKLYGFNKWANENNIDAMIHIHFNDYPRTKSWTKGTYKGFAIYMPEGQMINSRESILLAGDIFSQLIKKYITSTYEEELGGLIPDQSLISLGANDTLLSSVRSVLIEYAYIYRLGNSASRHKAYDNMASLTAQGIKNYFFPKF